MNVIKHIYWYSLLEIFWLADCYTLVIVDSGIKCDFLD